MNIYHGKTVLVTGHTGFKGTWLTTWLTSLGANVIGMSLDIPSNPSNFVASNIKKYVEDNRIDIRDTAAVSRLIIDTQPDFVFHLAGQALSRPAYAEPLDTLSINAMGTANVMEALRKLDKNVVAVMITSDKVYDNVEWTWGYRENDKIGSKDPYGASKGMAELAIRAYLNSFFTSQDHKRQCSFHPGYSDHGIRLAIARAGNAIGGGDWAKDRIVPDCMRAWSEKQAVDIRSPNATRPWQHVLELLSGYLTLGAQLYESSELHGEAFNFGPSDNQDRPVSELINKMARYWDNVSWNDVSNDEEKVYEAVLLKLNSDKAIRKLNWTTTLSFEETVKMTVEWYKRYYENEYKQVGMYNYTLNQIKEYTQLASLRQLKWVENIN